MSAPTDAEDDDTAFDCTPDLDDDGHACPSDDEVVALEQAHAQPLATAGPTGPYPYVDTLLTASAGVVGVYNSSRRWGRNQTIAALREVGEILARRYAGGKLGVGDISKQGGGVISGHRSHRHGVDADLRLVAHDWTIQRMTWQSPQYSRALTQELIDLLWANAQLAVKTIFFNDPMTRGTSWWTNHHNHIHVRFGQPGAELTPPSLAVGSPRHAAIAELQQRLNFWKLATAASGAPLVVDGDFGPNTAGRLAQFQAATGVQPGPAGPQTWQALWPWRW